MSCPDNGSIKKARETYDKIGKGKIKVEGQQKEVVKENADKWAACDQGNKGIYRAAKEKLK